MKVRCKLRLIEITALAWSPSIKKFKFAAEYDQSIPEDQRFAKASPSGSFEITVDNPVVAESYKLGEYYYFDSMPVSAAAAA